MAEYVLEVAHLAKSFGAHAVLRDVTFNLRRGEMVGITGENGSGKSTLLKILVGLLKPSAGNIIIRGSLGYCPQEQLIFDALTVKENFSYFACAYGLTGKRPAAWRDTQEALLKRFRFGHEEAKLVSLLSSGTRQKLNLSLALLHSPDVLILDEPYSGFDWETYLNFWDAADRFRVAGKSVVIVSHLLYESSRLNWIFQLKDGILRCA